MMAKLRRCWTDWASSEGAAIVMEEKKIPIDP
jgi:hypothetical protein